MPPSTLMLRLGLGIFLTLNIMIASWFSYSRELFGSIAQPSGWEQEFTGLANYLALFLCAIVLAILGLPLLMDAWNALFAGPTKRSWLRGLPARVNAQVLIVIGVFSAFLLSVVHTFRGEGSLYYDTAATVLVVVAVGSYLEASARRRAVSSARRCLVGLPGAALVARGDRLVEIPIEEIRKGDRVSVPPGELVPVDGVVEAGRSHVNESTLTGESRWRPVEPGDPLLAGSQNQEGQLRVLASAAAEGTVLAHMERSLEEARASRPPVQLLADRVAAVFVPGVLLLALGLWLFHTARGAPETAILVSLSVLLISCPCALGLAAPLACWQGLRRAAERGILIDSAATLERTAAVRHLFLDKTGTLTRPEPALERVTLLAAGIDLRGALRMAASLESTSSHPIARALVKLARQHGLEVSEVDDATNVAGFGVEGRFDGRSVKLGSLRWLEHLGLCTDRLACESDGITSVFLVEENTVVARFDLEESPRPGASRLREELERWGVTSAILSGDAPGATRRLAQRLGIPAEGGMLPETKLERLRASRGSTGPLAMVGDGINDAPVLAAADVGISMGSASELARRSGNVRLVSDQLDRLPLLFAIARDVRRRIRVNLLFAFGFNSIGVALAATGHLTPVFSAVAMVASSLVVARVSSGAGAAYDADSRSAESEDHPVVVTRTALAEGRG